MKKIILLFILINLNLFSIEIHQKIILDEVYKSTIGVGEYPKDRLKFDEKKDLEISIVDETNQKLYVLDRMKKGTKILSVFFYDINGDGVKEVYILGQNQGKNFINIYELESPYKESLWENIKFNRVKFLENKLNIKFSNIKNLNAQTIKKELESYLPLNYNQYSFELWKNSYKLFDVNKFSVLDGKFLAYYDEKKEKVETIDKASYYYVVYANGLYGKFVRVEDYGFYLDSIFEAYEKNGELVKNGLSYSVFEEEEKKINYKDGLKHGKYEHYYYDGEMVGEYWADKKIGRWTEDGFVGNYEDSKKNGLWINEEKGIREYYSYGKLEKEEVIDKKTEEILSRKLYEKEIIEEIYDKFGHVDKRLFYSQNGGLIEGLSFGSIKNSPEKSKFYDINLGKMEFLGDFFMDESQKYKGSKPIILNDKTYKLHNNIWGNQLKLFSIKTGEKELFIIMERYPQGFAIDPETYIWFGIREIFEGKRKKDSIENFSHIARDGITETFSVYYYGDREKNRSCLLERGYYVEGLKEGKWYTYFYPSILWSITSYEHDIKNGLFQGFNVETGELETEGYYEMDKKVGKWKEPLPFIGFSM